MPESALISRRLRTRSFLVFCVLLLLAALGAGLWWWLVGSCTEETDNAYVAGDLVPVSAYMGGQVTSLFISENADIAAGQLALTLDDADARIALAQAESARDQSRRRVAELYSATRQSDIAVSLEQSRVEAAELAGEQARIEQQNADLAFKRRESLKSEVGAISEEDLAGARDRSNMLGLKAEAAGSQLQEAKAALLLAREQGRATHMQTDGVAQHRHPELLLAQRNLDQARTNLARTRITSPVAGVVARRYVQLGQRVAPQQPLFSVVPLSSLYIEANFKETQTGNMAPGQCAIVISDRFGSAIRYRSVVESIGVGTGAVFARVPVQNAAGNWVKIVQRVPVRLRLDAGQIRQHPLSLGMSTTVRVYSDRDCSAPSGTRSALPASPDTQATLP